MSKQKQYTIIWTIDVEAEDINSPQEAVEDCWNRLRSPTNDWQWIVIDKVTEQEWSVDYEYAGCGLGPEVTLSMDIDVLYKNGWKQDYHGDWYHNHGHSMSIREAWKEYIKNKPKTI